MANQDAEVIIVAELNTDKAEKNIEDLVKELSRKKIELSLNTDSLREVEFNYLNAIYNMKNLSIDPSSINSVNKLKKEYEDLLAHNIKLKESIKQTNSEISKINSSSIKRLANTMSEIPVSSDIVKRSISGIQRSIDSVSAGVSRFGNKMLSLARNAFVFTVLTRGFRTLSGLVTNLVGRDLYFAQSLIIVKANLIRAFAPIFQVVLPWIRALGDALVWISQQLVRFINFLTGSNIKIVTTAREGQRIVGDFMKIVSPKKSMFDFGKAANNTDKIRKNLDQSKKDSNKLLASFDKLETLKFDKTGLENLNNINKESGLDKELDLDVDEESIEDQMAHAINAIKDKPLDFTVNDNLGSQIRGMVNGNKLPTLDFKIKNLDTDKLKILRDILVGIGIALITYKIATKIGKIVSTIKGLIKAGEIAEILFAGALGSAGWIALAAGLLAVIVMHWDDIKDGCLKAWDAIRDFGEWLKSTTLFKAFYNSIKPIIDAFKFIGKGIGKMFDWNWGGRLDYLNDSNGSVNIPRLAQGGVLRGGDPFLAYLNDQPRGQTNIETPLSTMVEAFREAISDTQLNQPQGITITANGDMTEFIRMLNIKLSGERVRSGNGFINVIDY